MKGVPKIKAEHVKNTIIQGGKEVPVVKEFTQRAWDMLGPVWIDGEWVPKQGFKAVSGTKTPAEAKSTKAKKAATKPKRSEAATVATIEDRIRVGHTDKLTIGDLQKLAEAKGLEVKDIGKRPVPEVLEEIKKQLK